MSRRAAIYARFSSHNQRSESIEIQVENCEAYCEAHNLTVVGRYCDYAQTGRTTDRAEFQRMMNDAKSHLFDYVVIYKVTRIMRNRDEMALARLMLAKCGVEILYAGEDIPQGSGGVLQLGILEVLAEYESALTSERIKDGIQKNAERCMANGRTLYGWDIVNGCYEVNEDEKAILCQMKELFLAGHTLQGIADHLDGKYSRNGKAFTKSTISKYLHRPQNAGIYKYAGHTKHGGMPALWSEEEQALIDARFERMANPMKAEHTTRFPLSMKLKDAECGAYYVGESARSKTGKMHHYYFCKQNHRRLRKDAVERSVADATIKSLKDPETRQKIAYMVSEFNNDGDTTPMSKVIQRQIDGIDRSFDNIWKAIEDGIAPPGGKERIDELKARRALLEEELAAAKAVESVELTYERVLYWLENMTANLDPETICSTFVSSVTVDGNNFHVVFLYDGTPEDAGFVQVSTGRVVETLGELKLYPVRRGFAIVTSYTK